MAATKPVGAPASYDCGRGCLKHTSIGEDMQSFTAKHSDKIQGVLSGFDRLIFRGSLRKIAYTFGLNSYLWANHVLLKDFGSHANEISERVKTAALRCVQESGRRIQYLQSSKDNKEEIARSIARQEQRRNR